MPVVPIHWAMDDQTPGEGAAGFRARAGWTREQAAGIERTAETTAPVFYPPETDQMPHLHIWDTWFLRERDGTLAEVDRKSTRLNSSHITRSRMPSSA